MISTRLAACGWLMAWCFNAALCYAKDSTLADAAERNDVAAMRTLLEKRPDVNTAQADGMTALHWATLHDDVDTVRQLISAGADVQIANRYGVSALSLACTNGNAPMVKA